MRHRWTEPTKMAPIDNIGLPWNFRTCQRCGMVKITKLPPIGWPWYEYQPIGGKRLVQQHTPPCEPKITSPTPQEAL